MRQFLFSVLLVATLAGPVRAGEVVVPPPPANATCPVCGMFVAKYQEWVAVALYKDGHAHYFDGAKDLFKYLKQLSQYAPGHKEGDIAILAVTDYYSVKPVDARQAFFVIGSDVLGPMGHELVAHGRKQDAEEFLKDHKGKRVISFADVTGELLISLDKGKPE
ncbi:MAG: nitrous oxide reductase accessory protein NosL [Rhodospirillales bacterium]|nr:MAG: nitrous oxide reductase accessory protein NosL [Rhodospirillales bacterium]